MKKLIVFVVLCSSCATKGAVTAPPRPMSTPNAVGCTVEPETMYGAPKADCKEFEGLGYCCGYGHTIALEGKAIQCAYMLCRDTCAAPFEASFSMCMPTAAAADPADETL